MVNEHRRAQRVARSGRLTGLHARRQPSNQSFWPGSRCVRSEAEGERRIVEVCWVGACEEEAGERDQDRERRGRKTCIHCASSRPRWDSGWPARLIGGQGGYSVCTGCPSVDNAIRDIALRDPPEYKFN